MIDPRSRVGKLVLRDLFNVLITSIPSRRVRRFWTNRLLRSVERSTIICLRTRLLDPGGISIGARSVVGSDCYLDGRNDLEIGSDVDIAPRCQIWTLEHDPNSPTHDVRGARVVISDHVWIASGATILPGVTIGRGAIVAAGSVVVKEVAELEIVGGTPARNIGWRDNPLTYRLNFSGRFR